MLEFDDRVFQQYVEAGLNFVEENDDVFINGVKIWRSSILFGFEFVDQLGSLRGFIIKCVRLSYVAVHFVLNDVRFYHVVEKLPGLICKIFIVIQAISFKRVVEQQLKQESQNNGHLLLKDFLRMLDCHFELLALDTFDIDAESCFV